MEVSIDFAPEFSGMYHLTVKCGDTDLQNITETLRFQVTYLYDNGSLVLDWAGNAWQHPRIVIVEEEEETESEELEDEGPVVPPLEMVLNNINRNGLVTINFN